MTKSRESQEEIIARWRSEFDVVRREAQDLAINHYIYKEVKTIIVNNATAKGPSDFHGWLDRLYASAAASGVRRLIGKGSDEITFWNLLDDIKQQSPLISLQHYRDMMHAACPDEMSGEESDNTEWDFLDAMDLAKAGFESICGEGSTHLMGSDVEKDVAELARASEVIAKWATHRIAHHLDREPAKLPTYGDIEGAIGCLEKLVEKYGILLNGSASPSLLPVWQNDWKAIFREAWLPSHARPD